METLSIRLSLKCLIFWVKAASSEQWMDFNFLHGMRCMLYSRIFIYLCSALLSSLAYRSGATTGVTAPSSEGFLAGLSTAFNTGLPHKLVKGAVLQDVTALHVAVGFSSPSVSTQIAALRSLLLGQGVGKLASYFEDVVKVLACSERLYLSLLKMYFVAGKPAASY